MSESLPMSKDIFMFSLARIYFYIQIISLNLEITTPVFEHPVLLMGVQSSLPWVPSSVFFLKTLRIFFLFFQGRNFTNMLLDWPFQPETPSHFSILKKKVMSLLCVPFPRSETPLREKPGGHGERRDPVIQSPRVQHSPGRLLRHWSGPTFGFLPYCSVPLWWGHVPSWLTYQVNLTCNSSAA